MPFSTSPSSVSPDETETFRSVMSRLSGTQKDSRGAPGYSRWINRRLGRYLAALSYRAGLTPNQVTAVSTAFTMTSLAILALVRPGWVAAPLIVLGLLLGYAIDSADGQLARLRGGGSPAGEWLDHVTDATKIATVHLVVLIAWYRFYDLSHHEVLLLPLAFSVVAVVFFFGVILSEQLRRAHQLRTRAQQVGLAAPPEATTTAAPALRSILVLPADYGVLCLVLILLPLHHFFIVCYALLLVANLVFLAGALRNWFRELRGYVPS